MGRIVAAEATLDVGQGGWLKNGRSIFRSRQGHFRFAETAVVFRERDLIRSAATFVDIGVINSVIRGSRVATTRRGQSIVVECRSEFANTLENEKQLEMLNSFAPCTSTQ